MGDRRRKCRRGLVPHDMLDPHAGFCGLSMRLIKAEIASVNG